MAKQTPTAPQPEPTHNQPSEQVYLTPAQELVALDDQLWQQRVDLYKELVSAGKLDEVPEAEDQLSLASLRKLIHQQRKQNKKSSKQSSNQAKAAGTTDFYERLVQELDKVEEKTTLYVPLPYSDSAKAEQTAQEVTLYQQVRRQFADFVKADKPVLFKDFEKKELLYLIHCPKRSVGQVSEFDQYSFTKNSHPFLVYEGCLYVRDFEDLSGPKLHDVLLEQLVVQRKFFPEKDAYDGWKRVWDYDLVKSFPKEDGRYPRSQVKPGGRLPLNVWDQSVDPKDLVAYIKTLLDGEPKVRKEFGDGADDLNDYGTTWLGHGLQKFMLYRNEVEFYNSATGISRSGFLEKGKLKPYYGRFHGEGTKYFLVFVERVYRAPTAEEVESLQKNRPLTTSSTSSQENKDFPEVLYKGWSTNEDVAAWLAQYGWVEVTQAAELSPSRIYFYKDGEKLSQQYQYTEEDFALFKLLPDGFYAHPPVDVGNHLDQSYSLYDSPEDKHWSKVRREEMLVDSRAPIYFADLTVEQVLKVISAKHNKNIYYGHEDYCYLKLGGQLYQFHEDNVSRFAETDMYGFAQAELNCLAEKLGVSQKQLAEAFCGWELVLDHEIISYYAYCQDGLYTMPMTDRYYYQQFGFYGNYNADHHIQMWWSTRHFIPSSVAAVLDQPEAKHVGEIVDAKTTSLSLRQRQAQEQIVSIPNSFRIRDKISDLVESAYQAEGVSDYILFFDKSKDQVRELILCDGGSASKQENFEDNSLPFLCVGRKWYRRKTANEEIPGELYKPTVNWLNLSDEALASLGWFQVEKSLKLLDYAELDGRYQLPISLSQLLVAFPQPEDLNALFANFCQGSHVESSADEEEWDDDDWGEDVDDFEDDDDDFDDDGDDEGDDDWDDEDDEDDDWEDAEDSDDFDDDDD